MYNKLYKYNKLPNKTKFKYSWFHFSAYSTYR